MHGLAAAPLLQELLQVHTLVNLGLDTDTANVTGIEQLRAAAVSVNGLA